MKLLRTGLLLLAATGTVIAQAVTFEVAAIKPSPPLDALGAQLRTGQVHIGMKVDQGRVDIGFLSLADLIPLAYRLKPYQVEGPDWMRIERFDILATLPDGASPERVPDMLQALLAERFKLAAHRDRKDRSVYALVVGRNGPHLEASPDTTGTPSETPSGPSIVTPDGTLRVDGGGRGAILTGGPNGPMRVAMTPDGTLRLEMAHTTVAGLAETLTRFVDRPVVDLTDLAGTYHVVLEISRQDLLSLARTLAPGMVPGPGLGATAAGAGPAGLAADPSGGSIFAAVERLGLKLEARKAPVDVIVIDHVEKTPTEN